tara:strand:- start:1524 stop:1952 length:429 start_codon:yes stop_codon:yes gene_type:complete
MSNKQVKPIRKSIEEINLEAKIQFEAMPFLVNQFPTLEDFQRFEVKRHTDANLIKGSKKNKALELIRVMNEKSADLISEGVDKSKQDSLSSILSELNKNIALVNENREAVKIVAKKIGYNFKLVNLNWNSEKKIETEITESE